MQSSFDNTLELNNDNWTVSFCRRGDHTSIVVETYDDGCYQVTKTEFQPNSSEDIVGSTKSHFATLSALAKNKRIDGKIVCRNLYSSVQEKGLTMNMIPSTIGVDRWKTWDKPRKNVENMLDVINDEEAENHIKFQMRGKKAQDNINREHNCVSWCRGKLVICDIKFGDDIFFANPYNYIKGRPANAGRPNSGW